MTKFNRRTRYATAGLLFLLLLAIGGVTRAEVPKYDHVVVVIFENHSYNQIIGNPQAPNFNALAARGANFMPASTDPQGNTSGSHAVRHPSQPNYLELYSGNNQGTIQDGRPGTSEEPFSPALPFNTPNLGAALFNAGYSFVTYSESLPYAGFDGDSYTTVPGQNQYERKHNPVANWMNDANPTRYQLPSWVNQPFSSFRNLSGTGNGFARLPAVSFVVPNEQNNMHDGSITRGDTWLKNNIVDTYLRWANTHNSLLIVTFDEDGDDTTTNLIPTIFAGAWVKPGNYTETNINMANPHTANPSDPGFQTPTYTAMNHYNVLATIEDIFGLPHIGGSAGRPGIADVFAVPPKNRGHGH